MITTRVQYHRSPPALPIEGREMRELIRLKDRPHFPRRERLRQYLDQQEHRAGSPATAPASARTPAAGLARGR